MRIAVALRVAVLFAISLLLPLDSATAQNAVALTGQVTSAEEGAMEGVLVNAKKGTITITVVSDAQGRYSFPASKLAPGQYALSIRAIGYDLDNSKTVEVGPRTTTHNLTLKKTEDLAAQMSNGEWLHSIPGSDQQKGLLLSCVGCHTLERFMRSPHDAETLVTVTLPRMQGYVNQSIPQNPQLRRGERLMEERGDQRVQVYRKVAEYLGTINLSGNKSTWSFDLKTAAASEGRATRVVYTEYDLPRETISPHDVVLDKDGIAWYSSFGEQFVGRLDPKTGDVKEYAMPVHKPDFPKGSLGLRIDRDGYLVARQHVPGRDRALRSEDGAVQRLADAEGIQHRRVAGEHGAAGELARRRQGLVAEQRLRRRAPARPRVRPDRDVRAVQDVEDAAQYLRRHPGLAEQRLLHRLPQLPHRPHRRQERRGQDIHGADATLGAAPRLHGCIRIGFGSACIGRTASACSTRGPRRSRNG